MSDQPTAATTYQHHVAKVLRDEGWTTTVGPPGRDGGVDVIAERDGRRLGVQVKMYGRAGRPVNGQIVREHFGAATEKDCQEFMIATDGRATDEAQTAADKLGVKIRKIPPAVAGAVTDGGGAASLTFDVVWHNHVAVLAGSTLTRPKGTSVVIRAVDGGGVSCISSGGNRRRLDIEIFRWTIERLLAGDVVMRTEIDERYIKRGASSVVLILSSTSLFETTQIDGNLALRLADGPLA